jgi:hypothetical protein
MIAADQRHIERRGFDLTGSIERYLSVNAGNVCGNDRDVLSAGRRDECGRTSKDRKTR